MALVQTLPNGKEQEQSHYQSMVNTMSSIMNGCRQANREFMVKHRSKAKRIERCQQVMASMEKLWDDMVDNHINKAATAEESNYYLGQLYDLYVEFADLTQA